MNFVIIQILIEIVTLLLLLYLVFFKSYFQEKGKNLATKEDVEEITTKVELIKTDLQYSLQARLSLRAEEHNALVDYYSNYGAWLNGILNWSGVDITEENPERLAEIRAELDDFEKNFSIAESRMELFVENDEIMKQKTALKIDTLNLQIHSVKLTFELAQLLVKVKQVTTQTPPHEHLPKYKELLDSKVELYRNFKEEQQNHYKYLFPLIVEHRRTITEHLRELAS